MSADVRSDGSAAVSVLIPPVLGLTALSELAEVLGGRTPTLEDIPRLSYTTMLIQESLRLYPPIWLVPRTNLNDDEIGGLGH